MFDVTDPSSFNSRRCCTNQNSCRCCVSVWSRRWKITYPYREGNDPLIIEIEDWIKMYALRTLNKEVVQDWHLEVGTRVKSERGDQTSLSSKNFAVERSKDLHKSSKEIPWMHHYFHDRVPIDANSKLRVGSTFRFSVSPRCSWQTQMEIT